MEPQRLGALIRQRREERGITPGELADWCAVDVSHVLVLEQGGAALPDVRLLARIAEALGYPSSLAMLTDTPPGDGQAPGTDTADAAERFLKEQP